MVAEDQEEDRRRWPWILAILAALIAAGLLIFFLTRPDMVTVPDVTGETEAVATNDMRDAGFEVDTEQRQSDVPAGKVIETDPSGGDEAEKGSTVTLFVSLGPGTVEVPTVVGLPVAKARAALKEAGFSSTVSKQPSSSVPKGRVIAANPNEHTQVQSGTTVALTVSTGVEMKAVPNVVGMSRAEATSALRDAGFEVNENGTDSDEPKDQVLSQNPSAGTEQKVGSVVSITYSNGVGTVTLDDYVGQKASYAQRKLANDGLAVVVVERDTSDESEDGIVLAMAPSPGSNLSPGDRVTLTVGKFTAPAGGGDTTTGGGTTTVP
jgi:serine/threonine-protein kinase